MKLVKDVGIGKKKLVKSEKVKPIKVPKFRELTIEKLYDAVKGDQEVLMYLPERGEDKKEPNR